MRRSVSVLSILLAFLVSFVMSVSTASAKKNCEDLLDSNFYECNVIDEHGDESPMVIQFSPNPPGDFSALLSVPYASTTFSCACQSKNTKKFEKKKSFQCVSENSSGYNTLDFDFTDSAIEGKVRPGGKKIVKGQGVDGNGVSISFKCNLD